MERLQSLLDPSVVLVIAVCKKIRHRQLNLYEVLKPMLDLVEVVSEPDTFDLTLR